MRSRITAPTTTMPEVIAYILPSFFIVIDYAVK
jgi:hypothetical protein